jgi:HK97 family phage portal protein
MRYRPLQISPSESQFIEQRRFTVEEVARVYGVPAHLLMQNDGTSGWGTAMAEANTAFVTNTLRPHLVRLEEVFSSLARRELGRGPSVSIALHEEALMRGATSDRWEMLRKNVNSGVVTADEARMAEGMPPLPDGIGAVPWVPLQQLPQSHVVDPAISEKDVV